jgi:hypothetical protein
LMKQDMAQFISFAQFFIPQPSGRGSGESDLHLAVLKQANISVAACWQEAGMSTDIGMSQMLEPAKGLHPQVELREMDLQSASEVQVVSVVGTAAQVPSLQYEPKTHSSAETQAPPLATENIAIHFLEAPHTRPPPQGSESSLYMQAASKANSAAHFRVEGSQ